MSNGNNTEFPLEIAIKKVKEEAGANFDETVEAHINLKLDIKKQDQTIRTHTVLPHGSGKKQTIAVMASKKIKDADMEITEADLSRIESGELRPKSDFDILISEPQFMPKLAKVAKILGPVGAMPSPKAGTVTENIEEAVKQFKKGKIEIRNEPNAPIIHTVIGKVSFDEKQLEENFQELLLTLRQNKPMKAKPDWIESIYLSSSMGPSVKVDTASL